MLSPVTSHTNSLNLDKPTIQRPTPTFRKATENDLDDLYRISYDTFEETYIPYNSRENLDKYYSEHLNHEVLLDELRHPHGHFYFIEYPTSPDTAYNPTNDTPDMEIVGYIKLNFHDAQNVQNNPDWIEVHRLYVKHSHAGLGIGRAAINFAIEQGRNYPHNKINTLWLIVSDYNLGARKFYEKMGLVEFGEHTYYLGNDPQRELFVKMSI